MIVTVRSWPAAGPPPGRSYVVDQLDRLPITDHDYRPLLQLLRRRVEGVLHFDWDIAVSHGDLVAMQEAARKIPDIGFVAPYPLFKDQRCAHRHADMTPVTAMDDTCALPAMGAIYLPRHILEAWEPVAHDPRMTDSNFANWSHSKGLTWAIKWTVFLVHLHWG